MSLANYILRYNSSCIAFNFWYGNNKLDEHPVCLFSKIMLHVNYYTIESNLNTRWRSLEYAASILAAGSIPCFAKWSTETDSHSYRFLKFIYETYPWKNHQKQFQTSRPQFYKITFKQTKLNLFQFKRYYHYRNIFFCDKISLKLSLVKVSLPS